MTPVIGIDASRAVLSRRTGTENYSLHIIRALCAIDDRPALRLYYPDGMDGSCLPNASSTVEHRPVPGRRFWTHIHLAGELRHNPVDLLFIPAHVLPITRPAAVVTVHDLGYRHVPADHPPKQKLMLDLTTRWNLRNARRIIAPSQFTADDITSHYPALQSRIDVIPHGVSDAFRPAKSADIERVRERHGIRGRYVLAVGTIQPRKNYPILAEAAAIHNRKAPDAALSLVIVGRPGWKVDEVRAAVRPFAGRARLTILENVEDHELPALYSGAVATVQPSRFEGFGMPILESMACGTPVIHAGNSSMPEVAGGAALQFPTDDADQLAGLVRKIHVDAGLHREMSRRGLEHAKDFRWDTAASRTLESLQCALHSR